MPEIEPMTEESLPTVLADTPGPVIVDFWADWCAPCHLVAPSLDRLAREHPEIRVVKVDVDESPGIADRYEIYGIPTLIRFDGGAETLRASGALPYERLLEVLGVTGRTASRAA